MIITSRFSIDRRHTFHKTIFIVLCVGAFLFGNKTCFADNLLSNSDFETGTLAGWPTVYGLCTVQGAQVHSGNFAMQATLPEDLSSSGYFSGAFQEYSFTAGSIPYFYVLLYAKSEISPFSSPQTLGGLKVEFYQGTTLVSSQESTVKGLTDWRQLFLKAQVPATANKIRFIAFAWGNAGDTIAQNGKVYLDDCILSTDPIPYQEPFELWNNGFENLFHDWEIAGANWQAETNPANTYRGNYSVKNITTSSSVEQWKALSQVRATSAGQKIKASLRVKTDFFAGFPGSAGISVTFLNSNGQPIEDTNGNIVEGKDELTASSGWTQLYTEITAPLGTVQVKYTAFFWIGPSNPGIIGSAWFDEARLVLPSHGWVRVEGRSLMQDFDGNDYYEPYFIKGAGYSPTPIGRYPSDYGTNMFDDADILNRDFPLLQAMNANTVRIWSGNDVETSQGQWPDKITQTTLDIAEANGLKVIAGFKVDWYIDYSDPAVRSDLIERFTEYVNQFKDHPAILFWAIGNENNYYLANNTWLINYFYSLVDEMAYAARVAEGKNYHPVAVINGDLLYTGGVETAGGQPVWEAEDKHMIDVDIWGANAYRWDTFGDLFDDFGARSAKPLWVSEFGIDAWDNQNNMEHQETQAAWAGSLWDDIDANSDITIGGTIMEYSDEWWKPFWDGWHSFVHDLHGSANYNNPDFFSNEEWYGIMSVSEGAVGEPNIVTPRLVYTTLQQKFAEDPYILHLGIENGVDVFPQETAENSFYTGAASARAAIRYLMGDSPSQNEIYNTYHWSGPGYDMISGEVNTALNEEIDPIYNFTDWYQTNNQVDAIANFVYWVDYVPLGGINCPAQVPVNGDLNWRTVRGISTDIKPHPAGQPMPNFTVYGLWMNDPAVSGLGFDVYQTISGFQNEYLPLSNGNYRAVYEPPLDLNPEKFSEELENANFSLAPAQPNPELKDALTEKTACTSNVSCAPSLQVSTIMPALPQELKEDAVFSDLLSKIKSTRVFDVYWKDKNKNYKILFLNSENTDVSDTTKGAYAVEPEEASILLEVDPVQGAFMQATWTDNLEVYPKISQGQAIEIANKYLQSKKTLTTVSKISKNAASSEIKSIRFVWSKQFKTSRFHPSYEITFKSGVVVIVHVDGAILKTEGVKEIEGRTQPALSVKI